VASYLWGIAPVRWWGVGVGPHTDTLTSTVADDSVLDEIQDNAREAGQRLRASLNLMRSAGMWDDANHRELVTRLSTALAMVEAAYLEARRRKGLA
jgi:hypothetical protein